MERRRPQLKAPPRAYGAKREDVWPREPGAMAGPSERAHDPYGILAKAAGPSGSAESLRCQLLEALAQNVAGPAPLSTRPEGARPGDRCPECDCTLEQVELHYECPTCLAWQPAADYSDVQPVSVSKEAGEGALRGRLRVVGAEAGWYQPDMDRNNPGVYSEVQKKTTFAELRRLNDEYRIRGGDPFPINVLSHVADNYNIIQRHCVKRSTLKRNILSALMVHCCISEKFTRTKADAAEFAKLSGHGIARGDDFIRMIDEDVGLNGLDLNFPRLGPETATVFHTLGLCTEEYAPLRAAIEEVVVLAEDRVIGFSSVLRSKVVATTCEVLVRARVSGGWQPEQLPSPYVVAEKVRIRRHTITRFRKELEAHHSHFAPIYVAHGLTGAPIGEVEAAAAPPSSVRKPPAQPARRRVRTTAAAA